MPRTKAYNKTAVLEKAMNLFWKNGYKTTSVTQLEKEMGINKFSIYSSFGSKNELFQASIRCYADRLDSILSKLQQTPEGKDAIRQYFYDFIDFSEEEGLQKGCLITNTANEDIAVNHPKIKSLLFSYTTKIRDVFASKLREEQSYTEEEVQQKADYLFIAMFGFSSASKIFSSKQVENYIQQLFSKL